ncbi:MAG: glucose-1-phosphate adenylyltransferase subunit GlgD [Oscillibacter sp.]|nr:glucose-1-phosphate adenylyltransferase subunit GlgD [Oscillibacter sp.]
MNGLHGIVFCYKNRSDLRELSELRTAASIPFGGRYRAVDFALSNLMNAGVTDVGLVLHGRYQSVLDHVGSGKVWDMSRKRGGLRLFPPLNYREQSTAAPFRGKMEALGAVRSYLREIRQEHVVLMEGDLVSNLPLAEIYREHLRSGADVTVVCGEGSAESEASFLCDADGRVREVLVDRNLDRGRKNLDVYLLSTELLCALTDECCARDQYSFCRDVLQGRVGELDIRAYPWSGYAAQIRSVKEYYDRSMQLLDPAVRRDLFCPDRPIRAKGADKSSTYLAPGAVCRNSLVAEGCHIEGTVVDSILFPGVTVGRGAEVRGCILFKETQVSNGVTLSNVIADKRVTVQTDRTLIAHASYPLVISKGSVI